MEAWWSELRFAARHLARRRGTSAAAVLALATGTGAATIVFSVLHGVLLRPLPFPGSERLVAVYPVSPSGRRTTTFSEPNFDDLRASSRSFDAMALYSNWVRSVSGGSEPVRAGVAVVSEGFFDVLGVRPALGRLLAPADHLAGTEPTAVVSHGFWQRSLGGTRDLGPVRLRLGERVHAVIGVWPPGPAFPPGAEVWVPKGLDPPNTSRTAHNWRLLARLRDDRTLAQARADASAVARRLREQYRDDTWMIDAELVPLREALAGDSRRPLLVLFGAVGFLMLAACANVANLLLAQAAVRQREIAVRLAIGAGRAHVLRQLVSEALLLSFSGGALGVLLAYCGVPALLALEPGKLPRTEEVGVRVEALAFSLGVSLVTALGLGLVTSLWAARRAPLASLAHGPQLSGAHGRRLLDALVASHVAATAALLVGAGLLGRSLQRLTEVDPGFRAEGVLAMDIALPAGSTVERLAARTRFHDELIARLRALPGVREAGAASAVPLAGGGPDGTFLAIDHEIRSFEDFARLMKDPSVAGHAQFRLASEGYFRALFIPLRRGRLLEASDGPESPHVAVISESLARRHWGARDPIGRHVQFGNMDGDRRLFTIVGVVGDVREAGLDAEPRPTFYASPRQRPRSASSLTFVARVEGEPAALIPAARAIVRELEPEIPPRFRTVAEIAHASLAQRRFTLLLLGSFAAAALLLAALGIYGVASFSVAARTREVGLRMAVGATPARVLRMVLAEGSRPAALGALAGVLAALLLSRVLASLLYEIEPGDPATLVGVAALLGAVALASCLSPAWRATRIDPSAALRSE